MEKLSVTLIAVLAIGVALPSAPAFAQQDRTLTLRTATAMDANRDGTITREEFLKVSSDEALWARLDRNSDGIVDAQELRRGVRIPRHTRH
jgi:hypothetical protein